jgi:integrase
MSADAIADVVATYARPLGWHVAPHDLRRTFAKLARSNQAPLEQIQLALGHQSIQTTQRYLGSELDLADAACDRLGSISRGGSSGPARRSRSYDASSSLARSSVLCQ